MSEKNWTKRFWEKVTIHPDIDCWIWHGARTLDGYGHIKVEGKHQMAHRLSYQLHYGSFPQSLLICHKCDNPSCINPEHLFPGTHLDNVQDMLRKGRRHTYKNPVHLKAVGEKHPRAKLSEADAIYILQSVKTPAVLAREFGINIRTICDIKKRRKWKHLSNLLNNPVSHTVPVKE